MALTATGTTRDPRDGSCHNGFNNKPSPAKCCDLGARAFGGNGWNGHCEPCWRSRIAKYY